MEQIHESVHTSGNAPVVYAGFWKRVLAYLLDSVIIGTAFYMILGYGSIAAMWLYFALMESSKYQATLGKMALNLRVTDLHGNKIGFGRATGRFFGKYLSSLILCIGYLMVAWTEKKQGLHDIMAKTLVIRTKQEPKIV